MPILFQQDISISIRRPLLPTLSAQSKSGSLNTILFPTCNPSIPNSTMRKGIMHLRRHVRNDLPRPSIGIHLLTKHSLVEVFHKGVLVHGVGCRVPFTCTKQLSIVFDQVRPIFRKIVEQPRTCARQWLTKPLGFVAPGALREVKAPPKTYATKKARKRPRISQVV